MGAKINITYRGAVKKMEKNPKCKGEHTNPKLLLKIRDGENPHDFCFDWGFIQEAQSCGVSFGTLEFYVYHELRFNEVKGKSKTGFSYAGYQWYADGLENTTAKQIQEAFKRLESAGLVVHVCCDERIYRNKTRIWISVAQLSKANNTHQRIEAIKVLAHNRNNQFMLGQDFEIVKNPKWKKPKLGFNTQFNEKLGVNTQKLGFNTQFNGGDVPNELPNNIELPNNHISDEMLDTSKDFKNQMKDYTQVKEFRISQDIANSTPLEGDSKKALKFKAIEISGSEAIDNEPTPQVPATPLPEEKGKSVPKEVLEQEFAELWKLYPRKEGKADGLKAYIKVRKRGVKKEQILEGLKRYLRKLMNEKTERRFIIKGGNWFKGERWEDEVESVVVAEDTTNKERDNVLDLFKKLR